MESVVEYVKSLEFTGEQLAFIAMVTGVVLAVSVISRILSGIFVSRDYALDMRRLASMELQLGLLKKKFKQLGIQEAMVYQAINDHAAGRITQFSNSVEPGFIAGLDQAILSRLKQWAELEPSEQFVSALDTALADRFANVPDEFQAQINTRLDEVILSLLESYFRVRPKTMRNSERFLRLSSFCDNALAERLASPAQEFLDQAVKKIDEGILGAIGYWAADAQEDDDINQCATEIFRKIISEKECNAGEGLMKQVAELVDQALIDEIEELAKPDNGDTNSDIYEAAQSVLANLTEARRSVIDGVFREKVSGIVNEGIITALSGLINPENGDDPDSSVTEAAERICLLLSNEQSENPSEPVRNAFIQKLKERLPAFLDSVFEDLEYYDEVHNALIELAKKRILSAEPASETSKSSSNGNV